MSRWKGWRVRLRAWLRRGAVERELDEELRWHLDMETDKHLRAGLPPGEARRRALVSFGNVERVREEHRDVRGMRQPERLYNDLRYAARGLARNRAFTCAAVVTLAAGIGANATAFGVVDALLFRPPAAVGDASHLYRVRLLDRMAWASYPEYADLRDRMEGSAELAAYRSYPVTYGTGIEAREIMSLAVSASYFSTLRVVPELGSFWGPGDSRADEAVVVLGYDFWQRELGGEPEVIGRTIEASNIRLTIVGVAPRRFKGVDLDAVDLFLPLNPTAGTASREFLEARNTYGLWILGRPRDGVEPEAVAARGTEILSALVRENPGLGPMEGRVELIPVTDRFPADDESSPVPTWLLAVTGIVLLIACANCSNLLVARGAGRRREFAIRAAIGASRGRIAQLLLTESLLLAALGGAAGLLVSASSTRLLYLFDLPPLDPLVDGRVLAFSIAAALATSLLVGLLPALRCSRADVESELKAATPRATYDRSRLRAALTAAQIALSIVLLVNAGLFVRSLRNVTAIDADFDFEQLLVVSTRFLRGTTPERVRAAQLEGIERLRAIPGVVSASRASWPPYGGTAMEALDGAAWGLPPEPRLFAASLRVGTDYFRALGLPLQAGRAFDAGDGEDSAPVVMINAELARRMGGERAALDRCVPARSSCAAIVGIVGDARFLEPIEDPLPAIYRPIAQSRTARASQATLLVRAGGPASELAASIRRELMEHEPPLRYVEVQTAADLLRPKLQPWRMATAIFTIFGGLACLLATVGIYSVIAYLVAARRPEIGIRMALGADRARIRGLVLGEGVRLVVAGAAIGLALAVVAARLLEHRLYAVPPVDLPAYAAAAFLMIVAALVATLISAERACRTDPNGALRSD